MEKGASKDSASSAYLQDGDVVVLTANADEQAGVKERPEFFF